MKARRPPPARKGASLISSTAFEGSGGAPERPAASTAGEVEAPSGELLLRAERLGHRVTWPLESAPPRTVRRRVFLDWGTTSTEPDVEELTDWLARGGVTLPEEGLRRIVDSEDTYRFPWATGQGRLAKAVRRLVPSSSRDEGRVGLEIEMGWAWLTTDKSVKLGNTEILAVSENVKGKDIPLLRLEVEGMVKGTPYIEAVFGPIPTEFLASKKFEHVRKQLIQCFSKTAPFPDLVSAFNESLGTDGLLAKFTLTVQPAAMGYKIRTQKTAESASPTPQTNVSLPYSKLGQSASGKEGDFAMLFEAPSDQKLFSEARVKAQDLATKIPTQDRSGELGDRRHMASLLTHYLFQEAVYRSKVEERRGEDAKHHFHVLVKTSLEDVVLGILSDREAEDLAAWAEATNLPKLFHSILVGLVPLKTGPIERETIDSVFGTALRARREMGRRTLPKVEKGAEEEPVAVDDDELTSIVHSHPRPSARIPFVEKDGEYYVVAEQRSKGSFLNDPRIREEKKVEFLRKLQTPSLKQPEAPKTSKRRSRLVKLDQPPVRSSVSRPTSKTPSSEKKKVPTTRGTTGRKPESRASASSSTERTFGLDFLKSTLGRSNFGKLMAGELKEIRVGMARFSVVAVEDDGVRVVPV